MARYFHPTFFSGTDIELYGKPFFSTEGKSFHADFSFFCAYLMPGVEPLDLYFGSWYGIPFNKNSIKINEIIITKTITLDFIDDFGTVLSFLTRRETVPIPEFTTNINVGIGSENISNIAVPAPYQLNIFPNNNFIVNRIYLTPGASDTVMAKPDIYFKIKTEQNYLNFCVEIHNKARMTGSNQADMTNYRAQILTDYQNYLPAGLSFYGVINQYHIHVNGQYNI